VEKTTTMGCNDSKTNKQTNKQTTNIINIQKRITLGTVKDKRVHQALFSADTTNGSQVQ
jgi:hypothetical protein